MPFPSSSDGKESTCNVGDLGLISGLGRSLGGGHGSPLQYSCLENPHEQMSTVHQTYLFVQCACTDVVQLNLIQWYICQLNLKEN